MNTFLPNFPYYETDLAPFYSRFWATFAHFDGVHYLRLALHGYADLGSQAFFPLYPLLIRATEFIPLLPLYRGVLISCLALLYAIWGLRTLFRSNPHLPWLLLAFPTAFFFPLVYTESLFLALSLWFFVALQKRRWLLAALLALFASLTRLPGVFLALALAVGLMRAHQPLSRVLGYFLLGSSGLLLYMSYLWVAHHDPLLFLHVQPIFGASRSGTELVMLPQVLYRYFRMLVTVDPSTWLFRRAALELGIFLWGSYAFLSRLRRHPLAVNVYLLGSLLLPTLTGTLSSFPRYILVLTPWLLPDSRVGQLIYLLIALPLLYLLSSLYAKGIFVS